MVFGHPRALMTVDDAQDASTVFSCVASPDDSVLVPGLPTWWSIILEKCFGLAFFRCALFATTSLYRSTEGMLFAGRCKSQRGKPELAL